MWYYRVEHKIMANFVPGAIVFVSVSMEIINFVFKDLKNIPTNVKYCHNLEIIQRGAEVIPN